MRPHLWLTVALLAPLAAFAQQFQACGSLANGFGPFDYRKEFGEPKQLVEGAHFKPQIEALISDKSGTGTAGSDLDYVLRAFPNHHRALLATMRLGEKEKTEKPQYMNYTVECYFERAMRYQPDDVIARLIYVTYLQKKGRMNDATTQLEIATKAAGDDAFTHHNIGMLYFDMKNYDRALVEAHRSIALGFPRSDLRDRLVGVGKWHDPAPEERQANAVDASPKN